MVDCKSKWSVVRATLVICLSIARLAAAGAPGGADHVFDDGVEVHFLAGEAATDAMVDDRGDPFFDRLSLLEIELRLRRPLESRDIGAEQRRFKEFVRGCVVDWTDPEKSSVLDVLKTVHEKCERHAPRLVPVQWRFIKTNGKDEGLPYTRNDCIIIPQHWLASPRIEEGLFIHEIFHVYSRLHPEARARLYRAIGFLPLGKVSLPESLSRKRLTNPDGGDVAYAIRLTSKDGRSVRAAPIIYSKHASRLDSARNLFDYIDFGLFEVRQEGDSWTVVSDDAGEATPLDSSEYTGFFEQIGHNTQYIIHPDEILADNAELLVATRSGGDPSRVYSPKVLEEVEKVLTEAE